jgi:hypothetical protein
VVQATIYSYTTTPPKVFRFWFSQASLPVVDELERDTILLQVLGWVLFVGSVVAGRRGRWRRWDGQGCCSEVLLSQRKVWGRKE